MDTMATSPASPIGIEGTKKSTVRAPRLFFRQELVDSVMGTTQYRAQRADMPEDGR